MSVTFANETWIVGTEKQFMAGLINYITGLDSRITCSSDVDDEYSESDLTHIPSFNFSIDGKIAFTLTRPSALSNDVYTYTVSCNSVSSSPAFKTGNPAQRDSVLPRALVVSSIISPYFILLSFGGFGYNGGYSNSNTNIAYIDNNSKSYSSVISGIGFSKDNIMNISGRTFYEIDGETSGAFISRFAHAAPAGQIDYIKSAVYMNGSNKAFDTSAIYDSSTVSLGSIISLKDGTYFVAGPHQLIKV